MNIKAICIATLAALSVPAAATTIVLDDGTVIETDKPVYISDTPLFRLVEVEPIAETDGGLVEPAEAGSPEWCVWYEVSNNGIIQPTFDPSYTIYLQNCLGD